MCGDGWIDWSYESCVVFVLIIRRHEAPPSFPHHKHQHTHTQTPTHTNTTTITTNQGSVLVFLPGVGEITRLCALLSQSSSSSRYNDNDEEDEDEEGSGGGGFGGSKEGLWVLPLHGALSGQDQALVFRSDLPKGKRKVIKRSWGVWRVVGMCGNHINNNKMLTTKSHTHTLLTPGNPRTTNKPINHINKTSDPSRKSWYRPTWRRPPSPSPT